MTTPRTDPVALPATTAADADAADVAAARRGDLAAAERLYRRHRTRIVNLARLTLGQSTDAEDIGQEAFLRALGGLEGYRGEATFFTWLCRITINLCRNAQAQQQTRRRLGLVASSDSVELAAPGQASTLELRAALKEAIARLSAGQREVLVCHDVLGMKHEEIAYALDCASGTSKVQLHRARLRVRELLREGVEP